LDEVAGHEEEVVEVEDAEGALAAVYVQGGVAGESEEGDEKACGFDTVGIGGDVGEGVFRFFFQGFDVFGFSPYALGEFADRIDLR